MQFGKQHLHVMERIRALIADLPHERQSDFRLVDYTDAKGESRPVYRITHDGLRPAPRKAGDLPVHPGQRPALSAKQPPAPDKGLLHMTFR